MKIGKFDRILVELQLQNRENWENFRGIAAAKWEKLAKFQRRCICENGKIGILFFGSFDYGIHQNLSCFSQGYRFCFDPPGMCFILPRWLLGYDFWSPYVLPMVFLLQSYWDCGFYPSPCKHFLYLSPLASRMTYCQDYVQVTFDSLLNIKEHLFLF